MNEDAADQADQGSEPSPSASPRSPRRADKTSKAANQPPAKGLHRRADGHWLLSGAVWHSPKPGSPSECEVPDCDRVLQTDRGGDVWGDEPDAQPESVAEIGVAQDQAA